MGRSRKRSFIKNEYRKHYQKLGNFNTNVLDLEKKIENKETFCNFSFSYKNNTYTIAPLFALLRSILDSGNGITYLDAFVAYDYNYYINGENTKCLNIDILTDIISNTNEDDLGKLVTSLLTSMYTFYEKVDDDFKFYIDNFGGDIVLAHKNIIGIKAMLSLDNEKENYYRTKIMADFLCQYEDICRRNTTMNILKADNVNRMDTVEFIYLVFKFYIEFNTVDGPSFDLIELFTDKHPKYLEWLNYLNLTYINDLDESFLYEVKDKIQDNINTILKMTLNSLCLGILMGVENKSEVQDILIKDIKSNNLKEVKTLEKENRALTKELSTVKKNLNKLEKYVEKIKNTTELLEYKQKVAELELKNKQLESRLEGANLRIETLEDRVSTLKEEASKIDTSVNIDDKKDVVLSIIEDLSIDDMVEVLKDFNLVIIGGTDTSYKRISNYLPNVRYIDAETAPNFDMPLNTDYIVLCTKILGHSHTRRAEVFEHSVRRIIKTNKTNPTEILKDIYNTVVYKKSV